MMADLQTALSRIDDETWHQSDTSSGRLRWLPLWLATDTGIWIGLDDEGRWVVGRMSGGMSVQEAPPLSPGWLAILDHDESMATAELSYGADKYGLPTSELLESLPIDDVIALALRSHSAHWTERALRWLETRKLREDIRELLPAVAASKAAGQRARHIAQRLMRQER
jgi:hypothetical protein